jgi:hypothetical protein
MTAKRRKLQRLPHVRITAEVAFTFEQIKKIERQCSCKSAQDECPRVRNGGLTDDDTSRAPLAAAYLARLAVAERPFQPRCAGVVCSVGCSADGNVISISFSWFLGLIICSSRSDKGTNSFKAMPPALAGKISVKDCGSRPRCLTKHVMHKLSDRPSSSSHTVSGHMYKSPNAATSTPQSLQKYLPSSLSRRLLIIPLRALFAFPAQSPALVAAPALGSASNFASAAA